MASGMVTVTRSSSVMVGVMVPVAVIVLVSVIVAWVFTTLKARAKPIQERISCKGCQLITVHVGVDYLLVS
jgi:hypothetical protein